MVVVDDVLLSPHATTGHVTNQDTNFSPAFVSVVSGSVISWSIGLM